MASDKLRESFTTPIGFMTYPHLNEPNTKGKYPTNKYHAPMIFEGEELDFVRAKVDAFGEKAFGKKWAVMRDMAEMCPLKQNKEGKWFLQNASQNQPKVADVKGTLIPTKFIPKIGSGTRGRLNVTLNKNLKGVNCYVNGVQIIELVEYGNNAKFEDASAEADSDAYTYEKPESESGFDEVKGSGVSPKASAF